MQATPVWVKKHRLGRGNPRKSDGPIPLLQDAAPVMQPKNTQDQEIISLGLLESVIECYQGFQAHSLTSDLLRISATEQPQVCVPTPAANHHGATAKDQSVDSAGHREGRPGGWQFNRASGSRNRTPHHHQKSHTITRHDTRQRHTTYC